MEKISEVLRNAPEEAHTTGALARQYDPKTKKFKTYCAIGYLACQKGLVVPYFDEEGANGDLGDYAQALQAYGIDPNTPVPEFRTSNGTPYSVVDAIIMWNDNKELSFEQIADKLEALGL